MSRPKLLLADDSVTIQKVVNLTFGDQGMDVFAFSDGDSAIARFDEIKPSIVLADVHMPGMSGYQLCERVRGREEGGDTPVLLLVGSFEPFDRDEAQRVGASGHLTKPFSSIADLVSTVEDLVRSSSASAESTQAGHKHPDTTDIDTLYEQSFVETVEIPPDRIAETTYDLDELDDEMIQTSYAGQDAENDGPFVSVEEMDERIGPEEVDTEPESLIAESVPAEASLGQPVEEFAETQQAAGDPFESVAAEPPAATAAVESSPDGPRISFDDPDLLEIPAAAGNTNETTAGAATINISPELIDLIVDKVVERLEERAKPGAAHSVSGS